ncbi:Transmembrane protein [Hirschfeldia incana]|nr:Transmembrane protein [Hirschfeldia incana]
MDSSTSTTLSHVSESSSKVGTSSPNRMDRTLDLESGTNHESSTPVPGMWRSPTNPDLCCIYRVPECLREVNPKAYTPQLILIGPLHRPLIFQARKSRGDITKAKSLGYLNTEEHKKIYQAEFGKRVEGNRVIDGLRKTIEEDEDMIRASYSESTAWIDSPDFVEMILHDSIFIIELMLRFSFERPTQRIGDPLMDEPCLENTIKRDLILLENQLPYFILEKLFDPIIKVLYPSATMRTLVMSYFGKNLKDKSTFRHFTDLFRYARVETLPEDRVEDGVGDFKPIAKMHNAYKLHNRGVKFEAVEKEFSIWVEFVPETGCLKIPCFRADDDMEMELRNIMAFEQSYYPLKAYVCDYVTFLDYLIDFEKDVDLLVEKGIIKNWLGHHGAVSTLVNKLGLGVMDTGSSYTKTALNVIEYYDSSYNKSRSILKRVYFSNLWRGTSTIAAACILILTLIQAVTSIIGIIRK